MKKGFSRWEVWKFNETRRATGKSDDLIGHVEARNDREALDNAFAEYGLRTSDARKGVYVKALGY